MKALLAAFLLVASPADAVECFSRDLLIGEIRNQGMLPAIAALSPTGLIKEIWVDDEGRWIELATFPDGVTCILDSGQDSVVYQQSPGDPA